MASLVARGGNLHLHTKKLTERLKLILHVASLVAREGNLHLHTKKLTERLKLILHVASLVATGGARLDVKF